MNKNNYLEHPQGVLFSITIAIFYIIWYNISVWKIHYFTGETIMSNEITVKLKCSIEEICNLLENKNFKIVAKIMCNNIGWQGEKMNRKELLKRVGSVE